MSEREYLEQKYRRFSEVLVDCLAQLDKIDAKSNELAKLRADSLARVSSQLKDIKLNAKKNLENIVWDKLVVAFFGETNAGKSTTIEICRIIFNEASRENAIREDKLGGGDGHVDGLIIGDGKSDFTRTYDKYNMQIDSRPFCLVDMPGIEGKEVEVNEPIQEALLNAHCVFYVLFQTPDEKIIGKISKYLKDWVLVYSVYNVRGTMYSREEQRRTLLTPDIEKSANEISEKFRMQLGKNYASNITVHSNLALFSRAEFDSSRKDLIEKQQKMQTAFGDKLYEFSRFDNIVSSIRKNAEDFKNVINAANERKISELAKKAYAGVTALFREQEEHLQKLEEMISQLNQGLSNSAGKFRAEIRNGVNGLIERKFSEAQQQIFEILTRDIEIQAMNTEIVKVFRACIESIQEDADVLSHQVFEKMTSSVTAKVKQFNSASKLEIPNAQIVKHQGKNNLQIDTSRITENLEYTFKDFFTNTAIDVGGAVGVCFAAGWAFGPVGAAIGAAAGYISSSLCRQVFDDGGLGKAREAVSMQLRKVKENTRSLYVQYTNEKAGEIDCFVNGYRRILDSERANISQYRDALEDARRDLRKFSDFNM